MEGTAAFEDRRRTLAPEQYQILAGAHAQAHARAAPCGD
jgi:hypothetical protein